MEQLLFSIGIVMPILLLVVLGWAIRKYNMISDEFCKGAANLVFYVSLPAKLFLDVGKSGFRSLLNLRFVSFSIGVTVFSFLFFWMIAALTIRDTKKLTAFVHGGYRSNYVYIGIPIIQNILSGTVPACAYSIVTFVLPLYNVLAVILFSYYQKHGTGKKKSTISVKTTLVGILKNPMLIGIFVALPFSILEIPIPVVMDKTLTNIGSIASPLALLLIGAQLRVGLRKSDYPELVKAGVIRNLLLPILTMYLSMAAGFSYEEQITLFILMATPTAMNSYIMTQKMGGDGILAAEIVMVTLFFSVIAIPGGLSVLLQI